MTWVLQKWHILAEHLAIALSALLRFTDFYLFGIIKLYLLKRYLKGSKGNINNQQTYVNLLDTSIKIY